MFWLFLWGAADALFCDNCTYVNCSVVGDCPAVSLDNASFVSVTCESSTEFDGVCRYQFESDLGSSCVGAFPAAPDQRVECARRLEENDEADCMVPGSTTPSCSGNNLTCFYRLLCGSESLDNCTDSDCTESCVNVETDCPLIDFNGADPDLLQTYQDCITSLSPLSSNTVCSYRVALNTSVYNCTDEGGPVSDTMNNTNVEMCNDALPMQYENCLDAVEVRCTGTVFECEYQLVECNQTLQCDECQPQECTGAGQGDCLPLSPAALPLSADVISITCTSGGTCLYDINYDLTELLGINCSSFVGNTADNYQILCQQILPEFYQDCKLREGSTPICSGSVISCEYYLDCKQFAIDGCSDAGCIEPGDCTAIAAVTNCPQIDFGSNITVFDLFCQGGECVYRTYRDAPGCVATYPTPGNRVTACINILGNSTVDDCFSVVTGGSACRGLTNDELLQCRFDLDGTCVTMSNCSDADPDCTPTCTDETECPYLDFDLNPETLASRITCVLCDDGKCEYQVDYLNVNCTALSTTTGSQTSAENQVDKRCGQLIPDQFVGCLFVDELAAAADNTGCTGTTLECYYRLRCDLSAFACAGANCTIGADSCVSGDDCLALPLANDLGATMEGRWTKTDCLGGLCQYSTLFDFNNITNVTDCTDTGDIATYCSAQIADFDGVDMTDLTGCLETDGSECMLTEPCLNCLYAPADHCDTCCPACNISSECTELTLNDPLANFALTSATCLNFANQTCVYEYEYANSSCANDTEAQALCDAVMMASCVTTTGVCTAGDTTCTFVTNCPTNDVSFCV